MVLREDTYGLVDTRPLSTRDYDGVEAMSAAHATIGAEVRDYDESEVRT